VLEEGQEFENFSKKGCFLSFEWEKEISPLLATPRKTFGKIHWCPPSKNSVRRSDTHTHKHVKLHHFCKKLCCIAPSGNTVQQHQYGNQSTAG